MYTHKKNIPVDVEVRANIFKECYEELSLHLERHLASVKKTIRQEDLDYFIKNLSFAEKKRTLKKGKGPGSEFPKLNGFSPSDWRLITIVRDFYFFISSWEYENLICADPQSQSQYRQPQPHQQSQQYPQSQYPQSQYPQSQHPQSQYPQSQYPQWQYPQYLQPYGMKYSSARFYPTPVNYGQSLENPHNVYKEKYNTHWGNIIEKRIEIMATLKKRYDRYKESLIQYHVIVPSNNSVAVVSSVGNSKKISSNKSETKIQKVQWKDYFEIYDTDIQVELLPNGKTTTLHYWIPKCFLPNKESTSKDCWMCHVDRIVWDQKNDSQRFRIEWNDFSLTFIDLDWIETIRDLHGQDSVELDTSTDDSNDLQDESLLPSKTMPRETVKAFWNLLLKNKN